MRRSKVLDKIKGRVWGIKEAFVKISIDMDAQELERYE